MKEFDLSSSEPAAKRFLEGEVSAVSAKMARQASQLLDSCCSHREVYVQGREKTRIESQVRSSKKVFVVCPSSKYGIFQYVGVSGGFLCMEQCHCRGSEQVVPSGMKDFGLNQDMQYNIRQVKSSRGSILTTRRSRARFDQRRFLLAIPKHSTELELPFGRKVNYLLVSFLCAHPILIIYSRWAYYQKFILNRLIQVQSLRLSQQSNYQHGSIHSTNSHPPASNSPLLTPNSPQLTSYSPHKTSSIPCTCNEHRVYA